MKAREGEPGLGPRLSGSVKPLAGAIKSPSLDTLIIVARRVLTMWRRAAMDLR